MVNYWQVSVLRKGWNKTLPIQWPFIRSVWTSEISFKPQQNSVWGFQEEFKQIRKNTRFLHEGAKRVCGRDPILRNHSNHCLKQCVSDHKSNFHNTQELGGECLTMVGDSSLYWGLTWWRDAAHQHCWLPADHPPSIFPGFPENPVLVFAHRQLGALAARPWHGCGCPRLPLGLEQSVSINWNDSIFPKQVCFGCWSWITEGVSNPKPILKAETFWSFLFFSLPK